MLMGMSGRVKSATAKQVSAIIVIIIVMLAAASFLLSQNAESETTNGAMPVHVGVAFQGNTTAEAKLLIDRVKGYTNLFVMGSSPVSRQENTTTEVSDYAVAHGLDIIVDFGYYNPNASSAEEAFCRWPWQH